MMLCHIGPQLLRARSDAADAISAGKLVPDDVVDAAVDEELVATKKECSCCWPANSLRGAGAAYFDAQWHCAFGRGAADREDTAGAESRSGQSSIDQRLANYRDHMSAVVASLQTTAGLREFDGAAGSGVTNSFEPLRRRRHLAARACSTVDAKAQEHG